MIPLHDVTLEMIQAIKTGHEYLLEFYPDYDYRVKLNPSIFEGREDITNDTGIKQRAFNIWWAIRQCWMKSDIGIEFGSGGVKAPFCISTDYSAGLESDYGGRSNGCHFRVDLDRLDDAHGIGFWEPCMFALILANHVMEHLERPYEALQFMAEITKQDGIIALIIPDHGKWDTMMHDKTHKHCWSADEFKEQFLNENSLKEMGLELLEFNTLDNNFSFDVVLRKI